MTLTCIKDIALTLAALSSIYVGLKGLSAWGRQLKGNTEYVLAKNMLTAIYKLREAIDYARNPFLYHHPDCPADEWDKLDSKQKEWITFTEGLRKRLDKIVIAESKLKSFLIEAEVVWGVTSKEKIEPLLEMIKQYNFAMSENYNEKLNSIFYNGGINTKEDRKEHTKILYKPMRNKDDDEYMKKLEKIISDIENVLKPRRSTGSVTVVERCTTTPA